MKFFKNKLNVVLTVVLLILIGVGVILGLKFFAKPEVKAIDFTDMYKDEIVAWSIENKVQDKFEFENEFDEKIESGKVIYQSIKEGDAIEDKILIIISDGPDTSNMLEIPVDSLKTEDSFVAWAKDNGLTNVKVEYTSEGEYDEGTILSIDPLKVKKDDVVNVKVFSNKNIDVPDFSYMSDKEISTWSSNNKVKVSYAYEASSAKKDAFVKQNPAAGTKVAEGDTVTISLSSGSSTSTGTAKIDETKYLGMKEEDFLKELKALGFTNVVKIEEVYSDKRAEGTICYYLPDGEQKLDTKIEYKVSLGKEGESSKTKKVRIDETKYLGMKEEDFLKELKELGFTNVVKIDEVYSDTRAKGTICYYLPDGLQAIDTKIEYKVSLGKKGSSSESDSKTAYIDPYKYLGVKEETFLKELKDLGFTNVVKVEEIKSSYPEGTVCYYLPDGNQKLDTKIEYKVSKSSSGSGSGSTEKPETPTIEEEKSIPAFSMFNSAVGSSYEETAANVSKFFTESGFTNVSIKGVAADYSVGEIISISVDGNTNYTAGKYKISTPIVVTICNKDTTQD